MKQTLWYFSIALLTVGMGLGRFLYTAIFPVMLAEGIYSFQQLSLLASFNYMGYLTGALLFSFAYFHQPRYVPQLLFYNLGAVAILLYLMSWEISFLTAGFIRFGAGISSAGVIVFGVSLLMQATRDQRIISTFFAGVGLGIIIGNELVNIGQFFQLSAGLIWLLAALLAGVIILLILPIFPKRRGSQDGEKVNSTPVIDAFPETIPWGLLAFLYGLAGFGYIITATYLPVMAQSLTNEIIATHLWSLVGLGALLSCYFWAYIAFKIGEIKALSINLLSQSLFVGLSYFNDVAFLALISALGVGLTFMGTTILVMRLARKTASPKAMNLLGIVTFTYGIGQIVGPILTAIMSDETGTIHAVILLASFALFTAGLIPFYYQRKRS